MTESSSSSQRWEGLDAFRGVAVIGMLLVNNPGNHDAVYAQLEHSAWNGCTFADLVFPFFLFVVGITTAISLRRPSHANGTKRIVRRAALIFGIGLFINWFPFYQSGSIPWTDHPNFFDRVAERLLLLRIPGVLQRIGIAYLVAALVARRASARVIGAIIAATLVGYWLLLLFFPDSPAALDRALFDWTRWGLGNHLWETARTWDPEGLLSTFPSICTVLLGVLCGRWMRASEPARKLSRLALAGVALIIVGAAWALIFPLNKSLWTSSFVLYTAGISALLYAAITAATLRWRNAVWTRPLVIFGQNPLLAYAGSELARRILHSSIKIKTATGRVGTDEWVTMQLDRSGFSPPAASLGWALLFLLAWLLVLQRVSRRGLFLRV